MICRPDPATPPFTLAAIAALLALALIAFLTGPALPGL